MKTIGLCRIGKDAELRYTPSGDPVLNLTLAYNYGRKGQDGKQPVQWINATLWGARGEKMQPYLVKGTAIVATIGDIHVREWEGKGKSGYALEGRLEDFTFASNPESRPAQTASQPAQDDGFYDEEIPF